MLIPFASNYYWLLVILFFVGTGGAMWNVCAWSLMSEIGERERKEAQVTTTYMSIAKIGSAISFLLSSLMLVLWGFASVFVFNGLLILLGAASAYPYFKIKRDT